MLYLSQTSALRKYRSPYRHAYILYTPRMCVRLRSIVLDICIQYLRPASSTTSGTEMEWVCRWRIVKPKFDVDPGEKTMILLGGTRISIIGTRYEPGWPDTELVVPCSTLPGWASLSSSYHHHLLLHSGGSRNGWSTP